MMHKFQSFILLSYFFFFYVCWVSWWVWNELMAPPFILMGKAYFGCEWVFWIPSMVMEQMKCVSRQHSTEINVLEFSVIILNLTPNPKNRKYNLFGCVCVCVYSTYVLWYVCINFNILSQIVTLPCRFSWSSSKYNEDLNFFHRIYNSLLGEIWSLVY